MAGTFNQSLQCTQDVFVGFQAPLPPVSRRQDHLPLSISIAPSYFGSLVLTVASPGDRLVSLLSIFPLSVDTQCPVLSVDPLSL